VIQKKNKEEDEEEAQEFREKVINIFGCCLFYFLIVTL